MTRQPILVTIDDERSYCRAVLLTFADTIDGRSVASICAAVPGVLGVKGGPISFRSAFEELLETHQLRVSDGRFADSTAGSTFAASVEPRI